MSPVNLVCRIIQYFKNKIKFFIYLLRNRYVIIIGILFFATYFIISKQFYQSKEIKMPKSAIKILCLINTSKNTLKTRAIHVNATWAQRCDKHYFLSYDENSTLPFINTKFPETRLNLWNKWRAAFQWVSENEIENFDYIVRTDDDSYFIMENLRAFLLPYTPNNTYIFGTFFKRFVKTGYISGGPGIIFTREALKLLIGAMYKPEICPEISEGVDDVEIGACAEKINITKIDTRDHWGRLTQLPWSPKDHFTEGLDSGELGYLFYPYKQKKRFECCSDYIISFHYVFKELIYTLEFLIYKAKTFQIDEIYEKQEPEK